MKRCPQCNFSQPDDTYDFCPKCGSKLEIVIKQEDSPRQETEQLSPKKNVSASAIIGGIIVAIAVVILPSIDKDTHGFDGQKNVHTSSKALKIHKVFPAAFSSSGRLSASAKLLAPDSDGFSSDFWLLRRRCVVTHQDEKDKKRRKDTLSGVYALVNRGYWLQL